MPLSRVWFCLSCSSFAMFQTVCNSFLTNVKCSQENSFAHLYASIINRKEVMASVLFSAILCFVAMFFPLLHVGTKKILLTVVVTHVPVIMKYFLTCTVIEPFITPVNTVTTDMFYQSPTLDSVVSMITNILLARLARCFSDILLPLCRRAFFVYA